MFLDVLGLEDTFWSPWPRSLKSSKIALSSAQGQHYFFESLKSCWKTPKTSRKICEDLFCFPVFFEDLFWGGTRVPVSLASSILVLERICPRKGFPWPRFFFVSLASSRVSSTPPLVITSTHQVASAKKTAKRPFGLWVKLPLVYHARWKLYCFPRKL